AQVAAMEMYENTLSAQDPENVEQVEITVAESQTEQIANEDAVEITFTAAGSVSGLAPYRDLAEAFTAENPDIIINVREPNYGAGMVDISTMANAADCFQWFPSVPSNLNEVVLNLDPLMDVDPTITAQDFFPYTLDMFRVQGQLVALPSSLRVPLIAYNKDLFDAAGVPYPQNGWTTDDFLETAVALTSGEGDNKQYGFATQAWEFGEFSWFVDLLSGRHFDDSVDPPKLIINNPETVAAVRWFTNLTTEYEVKPTFVTDMNESSSSAYQTRQEMLQNGRIAMWQHDIFNAGFGPSEPELNLGYVTFPIPPDSTESAGYQSSIGLFISADTEFRQECWRWITYLTTQHTVDEGLPAREAIARSDGYAAQVGEELASAYLVSMDTATTAPDLSIYGDNEWQGMATVWLLQSYTAIINDGVTVEEALDNGQNKIDSYYGCMVEQANFDDNQTRVDCLQEADDSLPSYYYNVSE
ncbi:MAG: extracellular solute-binding protein, partial [Anaerolineales bacterium]|nr:extracellular solute-binding protein [Anaerolineales bacterium]